MDKLTKLVLIPGVTELGEANLLMYDKINDLVDAVNQLIDQAGEGVYHEISSGLGNNTITHFLSVGHGDHAPARDET